VEEGNVDLLPGSEKKTSMLSSNTCSIGRVNGTRRSSVIRKSYWWPWTGEGRPETTKNCGGRADVEEEDVAQEALRVDSSRQGEEGNEEVLGVLSDRQGEDQSGDAMARPMVAGDGVLPFSAFIGVEEKKMGGERRERGWRAEGGGVVVLVPEKKRRRERGPRRQQRARSSRAL
jgi:hypothetical protein